MKELHRERLQNPTIHDNDGKALGNPQEIHDTIREHFKNHFYDEQIDEPVQLQPYILNHPITTEEVIRNVKKLSNGKAPGYDNINVELIKYGPENLFEYVKDILNDCIENCTDIETGIGLLVPILKPGKPKGPTKNLRPVTLLPIVRKILSCIVHNRIKPKLKDYLSPAQSAYREGRSTSDIIWAYRWIAAKTQTVKETVYVTGIDLSSTFDTIDRHIS